MAIGRMLETLLAVSFLSVALAGCGGGKQPEPKKSAQPVVEQPGSRPESTLEKGGADAALPANQRPQTQK